MRDLRWYCLPLALLAGCASSPRAPGPAAAAPPVIAAPASTPAADLSPMEFLRRTRSMTAADLQATTDRLSSATAPADRLRAAIAWAAPSHPARDDAQARRIAEEVAAASASAPVREFAALFAEALAERAETAAVMRRMEAKMRDDEKRIEGLEARVRDTERRAGDAERRASESEKKLEALKQIDKALSDRQNNSPRSNSSGATR